MSTVEIAATQQATPPVRGIARLLRRPTARVGAVIVAVFLLLTVIAPAIAPYDPYDQDFGAALQAPSLEHPFGTDQYGRDELSRVMYRSGWSRDSMGAGWIPRRCASWTCCWPSPTCCWR
jgi:peptide/nickel transport system permease protein